MAGAGVQGKQELSELALVETWRDRIRSEVNSQVRYAKEWGSLADEGSRLAPTLDGQIEQRKKELAERKARLAELVAKEQALAAQYGEDGSSTAPAFGSSASAAKGGSSQALAADHRFVSTARARELEVAKHGRALERFKPVRTEEQEEMAQVKGKFRTRGKAARAAKQAKTAEQEAAEAKARAAAAQGES